MQPRQLRRVGGRPEWLLGARPQVFEEVFGGRGVEDLQEAPASLARSLTPHRTVIEVNANRDALRSLSGFEGVFRALPLGLVHLRVPPGILVESVAFREALSQIKGASWEEARRGVEFHALLHLHRAVWRGCPHRRQAKKGSARKVQQNLLHQDRLIAKHQLCSAACERLQVRERSAHVELTPSLLDLIHEAFDSSGISSRHPLSVHDAHQRRSVVELEGSREVLVSWRAGRLVASHRKLEHVQNDVSWQVHVRRKSVGSNIQGEALLPTPRLERVGVGAPADSMGAFENADLLAGCCHAKSIVHSCPPGAHSGDVT
mmetsp:Transcript_2163/g.4209  ORF Transcript_2163/g.4209 Transcript_2163/m.4209 type:complete len:317 (-) Transcript_2163:130-1080(-)